MDEADDGARAIEVMALFEDAVVEVRHLTHPRTVGVTARTRAFIGAGVGALALALGAFVYAYAQAAARVPIALDAVAALGLGLGAWALTHGLLRRRAERAPAGFDVPRALVTPGAEGAFPLVRSTGTAHELLFTPALTGEVTLEGVTLSLAELISRGLAVPSASVEGAHGWTLRDGARVRLTAGENTWLVASVPAPRKHALPTAIDWRQQSYTAAAAMMAALFLAGIFSIPPDPHSLSVDAFLKNDRFPVFVVKPPEEEQKIPAWLAKGEGPKGDDGGGKAKGPNGKMGKPGAQPTPKRYAIQGPANNINTQLAKRMAYDRAMKSGILGVIHAGETSSIGAIWSDHDTALGHDAETVLGGLIGTETGESDGVIGGLGTHGRGPGGGGDDKTIGVSDLPTIGHDGKRPGWLHDPRIASLKDHKKAEKIEPIVGPATVRGGIDKEIVRRVIRHHLNEVKFCYEKELMKNQELYGRVVTEFTIAGNGTVLASVVQSSTLANPPVEQCIAGAVRRWGFPKPEGGGIVVVSYPFMLKSASPN
jgi:hypothetical protein